MAVIAQRNGCPFRLQSYPLIMSPPKGLQAIVFCDSQECWAESSRCRHHTRLRALQTSMAEAAAATDDVRRGILRAGSAARWWEQVTGAAVPPPMPLLHEREETDEADAREVRDEESLNRELGMAPLLPERGLDSLPKSPVLRPAKSSAQFRRLVRMESSHPGSPFVRDRGASDVEALGVDMSGGLEELEAVIRESRGGSIPRLRQLALLARREDGLRGKIVELGGGEVLWRAVLGPNVEDSLASSSALPGASPAALDTKTAWSCTRGLARLVASVAEEDDVLVPSDVDSGVVLRRLKELVLSTTRLQSEASLLLAVCLESSATLCAAFVEQGGAAHLVLIGHEWISGNLQSEAHLSIDSVLSASRCIDVASRAARGSAVGAAAQALGAHRFLTQSDGDDETDYGAATLVLYTLQGIHTVLARSMTLVWTSDAAAAYVSVMRAFARLCELAPDAGKYCASTAPEVFLAVSDSLRGFLREEVIASPEVCELALVGSQQTIRALTALLQAPSEAHAILVRDRAYEWVVMTVDFAQQVQRVRSDGELSVTVRCCAEALGVWGEHAPHSSSGNSFVHCVSSLEWLLTCPWPEVQMQACHTLVQWVPRLSLRSLAVKQGLEALRETLEREVSSLTEESGPSTALRSMILSAVSMVDARIHRVPSPGPLTPCSTADGSLSRRFSFIDDGVTSQPDTDLTATTRSHHMVNPLNDLEDESVSRPLSPHHQVDTDQRNGSVSRLQHAASTSLPQEVVAVAECSFEPNLSQEKSTSATPAEVTCGDFEADPEAIPPGQQPLPGQEPPGLRPLANEQDPALLSAIVALHASTKAQFGDRRAAILLADLASQVAKMEDEQVSQLTKADAKIALVSQGPDPPQLTTDRPGRCCDDSNCKVM
jgi:hypothetical protein